MIKRISPDQEQHFINMFIIKKPDNIIYDTADKNRKIYVYPDFPTDCPLGLVLACEVSDYLQQVFGKPNGVYTDHILDRFIISNYFVISNLCAIPS